jgi:hypothetical protein
MGSERALLVPFLTLPPEWAAISGLTPLIVMRRVCEWVVAGAFPDGSLIDPVGKPVPALDIYQAYLTVTNGHAHIDGIISYQNREVSRELIAKLLVTREGVLNFCERTNTYPPPSILMGWRRAWVVLRREKNQAPPECPDANIHAARLQARRSAEGWLNQLRRQLDGLQGKPSRRGPRREDNQPIDAEYWNAEWQKYRINVVGEIAKADDPELQRHLELLDAEWAAFLASEQAARAAPAEPIQAEEVAKPKASEPRLVVTVKDRTVVLDGVRYELPPKPFVLLLALCRKAMESTDLVPNAALEGVLWGGELSEKVRPVRDVVRDLRSRLPDKMLVDNNKTRGGYRLSLSAEEIAIRD